ncbi:MAG: transposase [Nitrosomonas sp.]|nr:transposase [Nitrosomonas sp.]
MRRIRFGAKSEALSQPQFSLFEEDWQNRCGGDRSGNRPTAAAGSAKTKRARAGRQPLPDHLPRIEHRHEPQSCQCRQCGSDLIKSVKMSPNNWTSNPPNSSHRHIRPQYACRTCETIVRNRHRRHQRRYGKHPTACPDHYCQIPRSPAAVSHHTQIAAREDVTLPLPPGGMGWTRRRGTATAG